MNLTCRTCGGGGRLDMVGRPICPDCLGTGKLMVECEGCGGTGHEPGCGFGPWDKGCCTNSACESGRRPATEQDVEAAVRMFVHAVERTIKHFEGWPGSRDQDRHDDLVARLSKVAPFFPETLNGDSATGGER